MTGWRRWCAWLVWGALSVGLGVGCEEADAPRGEGSGEATPASLWVAEVRAAHEAADDAATPQERAAAHRALERLALQDAPLGVAPTHARAVRQDLYFRIASSAAGAGDAAAARDAATAGLALGRADDVLTANLLIARGEAYEALGDGTRASADYLAAQRIHERLLDAVLGEEGAP
ncbi:MAG: hypothetical protein R3B40_02430 [Polyangiales bacterium]